MLEFRSPSRAEDEGDVERHVARLERTSSKDFTASRCGFCPIYGTDRRRSWGAQAHGVWPPPVFPSHSWFFISREPRILGLKAPFGTYRTSI